MGLPPEPDDAPDLAVDSTKILDYLLNVAHPEGGPKARFFAARGFSSSDEPAFIAALRQHAAATHLVREMTSEHGVKRVYEGPLSCPDGTAPHVRSVWHRVHGCFVMMLVTAYPLRGPRPGATT